MQPIPLATDLTPTFDWMASRYLDQTVAVSWGRYPQWMSRMAEVIRAFGPRSVVDAGCGPGWLLRELARRLPKVRLVGVDSSAAMLDRVTPPAERCQERFEAFSEHHPGEFDVVATSFVLRDTPDPVAFLRAARRVLRQDGHLVLLETHTPVGWRGTGFRLYFHRLLPWLGEVWLTRDWPQGQGTPPYQWLSETHVAWHRGEDLPKWLDAAGFSHPVLHSRPTEVVLLVSAQARSLRHDR